MTRQGPESHQRLDSPGPTAGANPARPAPVSVARCRAGSAAGLTMLFGGRARTRGFIAGYGWLQLGDSMSWSRANRGFELALLLVRGACRVTVRGATWGLDEVLGPRQSPFDELPFAVVVPGSAQVRVTALHGLEAVVCWVPARGEVVSCGGDRASCNSVVLVRPKDVAESTVGQDNWARIVRMVVASDHPGTRVVIGECISPAGNWSGTPPHKHDVDDPPRESAHEEAYVFRFARPDGWGILRAYSAAGDLGSDQTVALRDGTAVLIRRGYHQVVTGPGHAVYYPFILAGPTKPLRAAVDPQQAWLAQGSS